MKGILAFAAAAALLGDAQDVRRSVAEILAEVDKVDWKSLRSQAPLAVNNTAWMTRMRARSDLVAMGKEAVPPILELLEEAKPDVKAFLLDTLSWIRDERALTAAEHWSGRIYRGQIRRAAIKLLGRLGAEKRLREIMGEDSSGRGERAMQPLSIPYYAKLALSVSKEEPKWNPAVWNTAEIGKKAPDTKLKLDGKTTVILFVLADW